MYKIFFSLALLTGSMELNADDAWVTGKINLVAVHGGADTLNPGTTCFTIDVAVSSSCVASYIAIPNNNNELLSALLHAKATGGDVNVYYRDNSSQQHCPGIVFTPCEAISVQLQ